MDMQRKRTKTALRCSVTLILCMFIFTLESSAEFPDLENPSSGRDIITSLSINTEFGGFNLEISPDFSRISLISARLENFKCGGITVTGDITAQSIDFWPIVNNQFEADTNLGIYKISISGVFNSDRTKICGTWAIYAVGNTCSGTWESP